MNEGFFKLIELYQGEIRLAWRDLITETGMPNPYSSWRKRKLEQHGSLREDGEYQFHGVGCWIKRGQREVDFDFGHDLLLGGFDLWRLRIFAAENQDWINLFDWKDWLESSFKEAENQGLIWQPHIENGDRLFYVKQN
ncbi:MAG: hypothetical protein ABJD13_08075 [Paracoccaceae bacterium]